MICLCHLFISKDFSPEKLNDFSSVCTWGNILIIFQTTEKSWSHSISRELLTVICKTPMHLQQWRANAASFTSNFEIVRMCQGMVFYDTCFNLLWLTHGLKQFMSMPHTTVGCHRWYRVSSSLSHNASSGLLVQCDPHLHAVSIGQETVLVCQSVSTGANVWDTNSFTETFLAMSVLQPFNLDITSYLFLPLCSQIQGVSSAFSATALRFNVFSLSDN